MDLPWTFGPSSVAAFIAFIGILIFVHELGHFLAAKLFDIKVLKFSLGFGPPILSFKKGETTYQIAAIPLGGFVKMVGDAPSDEVEPEDLRRSFSRAPIHQRAIVALAGPAFNLAFPVLCFFAYNLLGPTMTAPVVGQIEIGQPAERAGLLPGDRILEVDGHRASSFERIIELIRARPARDVPLKVERNGEVVALTVRPDVHREENLFGNIEERGRIWLGSTREGTGVGVTDGRLNAGGFVTGDRVISIDGQQVSKMEQLDRAFAAAAGRTVEVVVGRPERLEAGDLLTAAPEEVVHLEVPVPEGARGMAALGLARSETFLRSVAPGGAAERAGLRAGDQVVAVNGRPIRLFLSLLEEVRGAGEEAVTVTVVRDGARLDFALSSDRVSCTHEVTRKPAHVYDPGLGAGVAGTDPGCLALRDRAFVLSHWGYYEPVETERVRLGIGEAMVHAFRQTGKVIGLVALGIYKLFAAEISVENVGGPIQLFQLAAQAAEAGVFAYLHMLALISVNLGLINLLPIPIFDGGHLLFCLVEAVKRRPLSHRAREAASMVGLVLLFALLLLALRNDIASLRIF